MKHILTIFFFIAISTVQPPSAMEETTDIQEGKELTFQERLKQRQEPHIDNKKIIAVKTFDEDQKAKQFFITDKILTPKNIILFAGGAYIVYKTLYAGESVVVVGSNAVEFLKNYCGLPFLVANIFSDGFKSFGISLGKKIMPSLFMSKEEAEYHQIVSYYDKYKKDHFNNSMKNAFESYKKFAEKGKSSIFGKSDTYDENVIKTMRRIANFPISAKPLNREEIIKKMNKFLLDLSESNQETIREFIEEVIAESNAKQPKLCTLYLQGASGTGKTRFAKILFEQILGLPYSERKMGTADKLGELVSDGKNSLFDVFIENQVLNSGIFFDEIDKSLDDKNENNSLIIQQILYLFDSERTTQTCNFTTHDISCKHPYYPVIIATGNKQIPSEAFNSRVRIVKFAPLRQEIRQKVCQESFITNLDNYRTKSVPKNAEEILNDIVKKSMKYEGLREMLRITGDYTRIISTSSPTPFNVDEVYKRLEENTEKERKEFENF